MLDMRTRVRVRLLVGAALIAVLAAPVSAYAATTISISAPRFDFSVTPGSGGSGEVVLLNDGTEPVSVKVYFADQVTSPSGDITYVAPGLDANPSASPAMWFSTQFTTPTKAVGNVPYYDTVPGQNITVKFAFTAPANALPGDRNVILFFETFNPSSAGAGATGSIGSRLGSRIHLQIGGQLVEKVDVRPFAVPSWLIGGEIPYAYTIRNDGNVDEHLGGSILLLDRNESEVASSTVATSTPLYPRTSNEHSGVLSASGAWPSPFVVRLTVTYTPGDDPLAAKEIVKERTVWILPLWSVIGAGAVVLVLVVGMLALLIRSWLRRRKHSSRVRGSRGRHGAKSGRMVLDLEDEGPSEEPPSDEDVAEESPSDEAVAEEPSSDEAVADMPPKGEAVSEEPPEDNVSEAAPPGDTVIGARPPEED
jgi:hypothetical protein